MVSHKVKLFSVSRYVKAAEELAQYEHDENRVIVATVPVDGGFFAQGDTHEEARANLEDVIEGNVTLALQLGWDIPQIPGVDIEVRDVDSRPALNHA